MSWKIAVEGARHQRPWSLAARLTVWYALSAFVLVIAATGFLYWALVTNLNREDDQFLVDQLHILRVLLRDHPEDADALKQEVEWEWAARQYSQIYMRILDKEGHLIAETPGMSRSLPSGSFPDAVDLDAEPEQARMIRSSSGAPFRALAARFVLGSPGRDTRVLQLALDRAREEDLLAGYRRRLWVVLGAAVVGCSALGYGIARRGIRPVQQIARTAQRVRSTTLHQRIATNGLPAELLALAGMFNEMLDRLQESFARLSRFSADIAHELRTPVNTLRGEAEVALTRPRTPEEYREVLASSLEEYGRLARMIDALLFLARAESPENWIDRRNVDVYAELMRVREFYEAAATEAGVVLALQGEAGLEADLDRTLFQRAVGNLVANSLAHTDPGGAVTMSATRHDAAVRVEVSDTGCGIPPDHLPHLFDRFYRVDPARSRHSGGVGLGLAIVQSIVSLHGGTVGIVSAPGRGTRVSLFIPDAGTPPNMTNS